MEILARVYPYLTGAELTNAGEIDARWVYALLFAAIILSNTVHEFGHALVADRLGDPTPREQKRLTLSPFAHLDPLGVLMFIATALLGFPIGWGRPVRTNPANFRCGEKIGLGLVATGGPLMNFAAAFALAPLARFVLGGGLGESDRALYVLIFLIMAMLINLSQACFNLLIPVAPLDGAHILASLLPDALSKGYRYLMAHAGPYLLLAIMFSGVMNEFVLNIVLRLFLLLIGVPSGNTP